MWTKLVYNYSSLPAGGSSSKKTTGGKNDTSYDPTKTPYDPVTDACWDRGAK